MEPLTKTDYYAQNMDRKKFIQTSANDFLSSGINQLMLLYRVGVSEREARYITKKIETLVKKENPSALVEMYTDMPPSMFKVLSEQKQDMPMDLEDMVRRIEELEEKRL